MSNDSAISCLMVTQPGRLGDIRNSIACFAGQDHAGRHELVIVHDGVPGFHDDLQRLAYDYREADIRLHAEPGGQPLGALRNRSLEIARYPLVCQWDDDDLYHPSRLARQYRCLVDNGADFCFLTDQLHLFVEKNFLFWDDWSVEAWPGNLIQGTLLGRRELLLGRYPDLERGEDTGLTKYIVSKGHRIATLSGMGWLYIYRYTGSNAWDFGHHAAISQWKRLDKAALEQQAETLEQALAAYPSLTGNIVMPHEHGRLTISLAGQSSR